jgi:hypothetical protein
MQRGSLRTSSEGSNRRWDSAVDTRRAARWRGMQRTRVGLRDGAGCSIAKWEPSHGQSYQDYSAVIRCQIVFVESGT